jgi:Asp-tRNA(Asn)/Glu-tRNA(Gln) amidotransferase A subunit family amidase
VVVGVANQHELGMGTTGAVSVYGPALNPVDRERLAGGSSGGSAAAVGARLVAGSIGSDSGGSTRLPAAYCGVVGLKTTWGSVPRAGYTGAATTLSAAGAFGRDAEDTRVLAQVLAARAMPAGDGAKLRVGVVGDPFWTDLDPGVEARCREALQASGWVTEERSIQGAELCPAATAMRLTAEFGATLREDVVRGLAPLTQAVIRYTSLSPGTRVARADRVRAHLRAQLAAAFARVDVLAWPTSPATAPRLDNPTITLPSGVTLPDPPNLRQATLSNFTGVPGISIPVGSHPDDGMPVGLQLHAPWGEEARLLDAAAHLERALA